ncbi:DNA cytosine methyltransferase [Bradyrhizobium sp. SZCCHNS2002]|uniref:DNA cytosine methyltransferase n=1 Tax=Bradyrhizobium sp. SZCCHNS2002 TaxID=3057302 RepID=UPI0029161915|nr:DNA cytosine methyltransferase [Bradyrhizobium sp. SZCCHNS2002]
MIAADALLIRQRKVARLRSGGTPRALEICSGAGGLSLGLHTAGMELAAHIEIDPEAAASYAFNFANGRDLEGPWALPRDMERVSADQLVAELKLPASAADSFDVLAAGLPCQAFARIGRSKLRSVSGGEEDAFQKDPRASLYRRFLKYVEDTQPLAIIIENVPDILNFGGHNVPEEICENLEAAGYSTGYTLLNAAYFGVPQIRERLFIVALARVLGEEPRFPEPTHFAELPIGYQGSRRVALKHVDQTSGRFHELHQPVRTLKPAVSTREALGDLPRITEHATDPKVIRRRRLTDELPYRNTRNGISDYARLMREWKGFATETATDGHLVRLTPRDFPIFEAMDHGADYPQAKRIAEEMFDQALRRKRLIGVHKNSATYRDLRAAMVPPYDPEKFPNKWWKLDPSRPSRTLTAHMGKDTYSHIHYDSQQCRTISVREAARLQSFPDGFAFAGAMNAAFRQIGNAVPPLLGLAVARVVREQLDRAARSADITSDRQVA